MNLEQHVYTSGKPEFMTVAVTGGISRENRLHLEHNSLYFLPVSLHYEEHVTTPVKYIWYPLADDLFAVGRAVYRGKDSLGRTGNYLFHNVVLSRQDLLTACGGNPVALITCLRQQGLFLESPPAGDLAPISLPDDACVVPNTGLRPMERPLLRRLLHACLHPDALRQPVLLLGTADECLGFLEELYTVLPYDARLTLKVDTYAYGVSLGFPLIGSVDEAVYRQGLSASCTVHVSTCESSVQEDVPEPSPYLAMLADLIAAGDMRAVEALCAVEHQLARQDFAAFTQQFHQAPAEIQRIVWQFHRSQVLEHVIAAQDAALLRLLRPLLALADLDALDHTPELLEELIADHDADTVALMAHWLCVPGSKAAAYPMLFASQPLWTAWLDAAQANPAALTGPLAAFPRHYSREFERILLERLALMLPALRDDRTLARELAEALAALPPLSDSAAEEPDQPNLVTLRKFVQYAAGNDDTLLNEVLTRDLARLPAPQRRIVVETSVQDLLTGRTLKTQEPETVTALLRGLLAQAEQHPEFGREALTALSRLDLSKDAHAIMLHVVSDDVQAALLQGPDAPQIQALIDRILEPPPSLLTQLARRFFHRQ